MIFGKRRFGEGAAEAPHISAATRLHSPSGVCGEAKARLSNTALTIELPGDEAPRRWVLRPAQEVSMNDPWERFLVNVKGKGQSSAAAWSDSYRLGDHSVWDHASPSTELIGYILGARLPPGTRALDLGCGTGADAIFLAKQNFEVHGVDFSEEALLLAEQHARERNVVVDWRECSALNM